MSEQLAAWIQCDTDETAQVLAGFLARETRPLFEEDVAENWRPLFAAVEDSEYPEDIDINDDKLWLSWTDVPDFDFGQLKESLDKATVRAMLVFEVPDNAGQGDTAEDDFGWFWVPDQGTDFYKKCSRLELERDNPAYSPEFIKRLPKWAGKG